MASQQEAHTVVISLAIHRDRSMAIIQDMQELVLSEDIILMDNSLDPLRDSQGF